MNPTIASICPVRSCDPVLYVMLLGRSFENDAVPISPCKACSAPVTVSLLVPDLISAIDVVPTNAVKSFSASITPLFVVYA